MVRRNTFLIVFVIGVLFFLSGLFIKSLFAVSNNAISSGNSKNSRGKSGNDENAIITGWQIIINASSESISDRGRWTAGSKPDASLTYDSYDIPMPASQSSLYLDLYSRHERNENGWGNQPQSTMQYQAEYGPPLDSQSRVMHFYIASDQAGAKVLTWDIQSNEELQRYHITLIDETSGFSIDMRAQSNY